MKYGKEKILCSMILSMMRKIYQYDIGYDIENTKVCIEYHIEMIYEYDIEFGIENI